MNKRMFLYSTLVRQVRTKLFAEDSHINSMTRFRLRSLTALIGTALIALVLASCSPIIIQYEPQDSGMLAIPARSNVEVLVNRSGLSPGNMQLPGTVKSIRSSVERDIREGYFQPGTESVKVIVEVQRLSYEREYTGIHNLANGLSGVGTLMFLGSGSANSPEMTLTGLALTALGMSIPDRKYYASAEMSLKLLTEDGSLIANYQTVQRTETPTVSEFGDKKADPRTTSLGGGIVKDVVRSSVADIRQRVQRDREYIVEALGGAAPAAATVPAREAQFVETGPAPETVPEGEQINIAVVDLEAYGISETEAQALTNRLRIELFQTGRFAVVERDRMRAILEEQDFQQTGCTTNECLVEVGQLLNVAQIIAGSVSKVGDVFSIEVRVIDVRSGEIVDAAIVDVMGAISDVLTEGMGRAAQRLAR